MVGLCVNREDLMYLKYRDSKRNRIYILEMKREFQIILKFDLVYRLDGVLVFMRQRIGGREYLKDI